MATGPLDGITCQGHGGIACQPCSTREASFPGSYDDDEQVVEESADVAQDLDWAADDEVAQNQGASKGRFAVLCTPGHRSRRPRLWSAARSERRSTS